jgi:hypothetical protein
MKEYLSEFCFIAKPNQTILIESDLSYCSSKTVPLTICQKILNIFTIIGYVLLGIILLGIVGIAIWGIIQWPWMIVFLFAGLLVGRS